MAYKKRPDINEEEQFEEEYFKEDGGSLKLRLIILFGILFAFIIILVVIFMLTRKPKEETGIQNDILEYSSESTSVVESIPTPEPIEDTAKAKPNQIIDRNDEASTPSPSPEITPKPMPTATPEGPYMEINSAKARKLKKSSYDTKRNLSELESYFVVNDLHAMDDLAHLDRYIAMSLNLDYKSGEYAYYGDTNSAGQPHGKGIAVYADNQYYCGEWVNGRREGAGVWVHYHIHLEDNYTDPIVFHEFIGNFKNDLPDGHGQDHYEYDLIRMIDGKKYFTNIIGNFTKGLIDGEIYITTQNKADEWQEFEGTAQAGSFIPLSENDDPKATLPVLMNTHNPDEYIWLSREENRNIGVISYISNSK